MDSIVERLFELVVDPQTPPEAVRLILVHAPWLLRHSLAASPRTPVHILEDLLERGEDERRFDMLRVVIGNPGIPIHILEKLSWDERAHVRGCVAECPLTPVSILERFLLDDDDSVRYQLARNPGLPPQMLERLRHDPTAWVRSVVERIRFEKLDLTPPP